VSSVAVPGGGGRASQAVFRSPLLIILSALLSAALVGAMLARDVQLAFALLAATVFLPVALLNLPVAIACWVLLAHLEAWPAVRYVPAGVALLIGLAWLGHVAVNGQLVAATLARHRGAFVLLGIFLGWITLSLAWADDLPTAANQLYIWYWAGAIPLVVATTLATRRELALVCIAFVIAALISIAIALPQLSTGGGGSDLEFRLGGSLQNPNYLAAALLSSAALAAGLVAVVGRGVRRNLLLVALGVIGVAMLLTGSRGGLIAAGVALLAAFFLMGEHRLRLGVVVAVCVGVGVIFVATASGGALERVREFDPTGTGRVDLWDVAVQMWEDNPIFGVGYANFPTESPQYLLRPGQLSAAFIIDEPQETHNAYLGLLAENGIVGLGLFVAVVVSFMRATWVGVKRLELIGDRRYAVLGRAVLIAQIGQLAALVFSHNPFNHPFWLLLALGPVLVMIGERDGVGEANA
jgi:O-antigen ligase